MHTFSGQTPPGSAPKMSVSAFLNPSPKGRGRLEDSEATLATDNVLAQRTRQPGNLNES